MNISHITNVRRSVTPKQKPNYKALKNYIKSKKNKLKIKIFSRYQNSNTHLNELIEKMKGFRNLLNKTTDLKSLLLLDTCGLIYSNELKKIVNNFKKNIFPLPHHKDFSMKAKEKSEKKDKIENKANSKLFLILNKKRKNTLKKDENNNEKIFDLSDLIKTNKEKTLNKNFIINSKKNKKLLNLKAQILDFDKRRLLSSKKNKNIEYIRNTIKKNIYDKIKSKYKRPKTSIKRLRNNNNNTTRINDNLISFHTPNYFSNNNYINFFSEEVINEDENNYYKEIINSNISKNKPNIENINEFIENKNYNGNITPNISLFRTSRINSPHIPIRQKFKQVMFSNNSQETTTIINSPNESNTKNIIQNRYYQLKENPFQNSNKSLSLRVKKKNFIEHLNKLEKKSNIINQNFSYFSDKSQEIGEKFFNKSFQRNNNEELNIKEINEYFNFSKGFENSLENLLKKNANKVKKIIDIKGGKILDRVIKEICLEEKKLNKNYFLYNKEEKSENKTQILNQYNEMIKEGNDIITNMFQNKEKDFFNDIRFKKDYVNDIETLYRKAKIINKFGKTN